MKRETIQKLKAEVFWTFTRSGAFQRARIYKASATDKGKKEFRKETKQFLFENIFLKLAKAEVSEKKLTKIIEKLIQLHKGRKCLIKENLKFGNAQKFVNLYLKVMWIMGGLKNPPHFPVDGIMIKALGLKYTWTNMDYTQYLTVIFRASEKSKNEKYVSMAEWEADYYQKKYVDKKEN